MVKQDLVECSGEEFIVPDYGAVSQEGNSIKDENCRQHNPGQICSSIQGEDYIPRSNMQVKQETDDSIQVKEKIDNSMRLIYANTMNDIRL